MSDRKPCEICGETDCEDSSIEYYIECWKEAEAALKARDAEIALLKKRVRELEYAVPCDSCVHIYDSRNAAGSVVACKKCYDGSGWEAKK